MKPAGTLIFSVAAWICMVHSMAAQNESARIPCQPAYSGRYRSADDSLQCAAWEDSARFYFNKFSAKELPDALEHLVEPYVLAYTRAFSGGDHPAIAAAKRLGAWILQHKDISRSLMYADSALAIYERMYSCPSVEAAACAREAGYYHALSGNKAIAESRYKRALAFLASDEQEMVEAAGEVYFYLGLLHDSQKRHAGAADSFREAALRSGKTGDSASTIERLGWLGNSLQELGDFQGAETAFKEAYSLAVALKPRRIPLIIASLNDLTDLYIATARNSQARRTSSETLEILSNPAHSEFKDERWSLLTSLGNLALDEGDAPESERYYKDAIALSREMNDAPRIAGSLINLGSHYARRGMREEAAELLMAAREELGSSPEIDHPEIFATLTNNLGSIFTDLTRFEKAESMLETSKRITEALYGPASPRLVQVLNNLAVLHMRTGHLPLSAELFRRSINTAASHYGSNHPITRRVKINLGGVELDAGMTDSAYRHLSEAETSMALELDVSHPDRLESLRLLMKWHTVRIGHLDAASNAGNLIRGASTLLRQSFEFESEGKQLQFYNKKILPCLDAVARWCMATNGGEGAADLFAEALLRLKGAVLGESVRRSMTNFARGAELEMGERLAELNGHYASLASADPVGGSEKVNSALKDRLMRESDSLDAAMRILDREYDKLRKRQDAGLDMLKRALRQGEALVDFYGIPAEDPDAGREYVAVVLKPSGPASFVRLCTDSQLNPHVTRHGAQRHPVEYAATLNRLSRLIWRPIAPLLTDVRKLVLSPDGILHRISFAELPAGGDADSPVLDDVFQFTQIGGAGELLARLPAYMPRPYRQSSRIVFMGDPDFEGNAAIKNKNGHDGRKGWAPLPGTRLELDRVSGICREKGLDVTLLTGNEASESALRSLDGQAPRVLHLATHGFFFPVLRIGETAKKDSAVFTRGGEYLRSDMHPLMRSGIVLAGVNSAWRGAPAATRDDDGILTALELANMDLTGSELVVLSACETALGDIRNGEGIFGLQRALRAAGASAMIMSLRRVPDQATAELMESFYDCWLGGMTRPEALRTARKRLRDRGAPASDWGGFILIGE